MRKVYTIGETVFDIIFKNTKPVEGKAGGAMLNTAVSLGKAGIPVALIGDCANDSVGRIILDFLKANRVSTDYITLYDQAKSRLALAFLDNDNNAEYSFYKLDSKEKVKFSFPETRKDDIVLFGSFQAIKKDIRTDLVRFLKKARSNKSIIIYDPNFRKSHLGVLNEALPYIEENTRLAHIVKGSDEDFRYIFNVRTAATTFDKLSSLGSNVLIYTRNKNGVDLHTPGINKHFAVPVINPVSTIGAGDSFSAGLIYALLKNGVTFNDIDSVKTAAWDKIIPAAIDFATDVCMNYDNYISDRFVKSLL